MHSTIFWMQTMSFPSLKMLSPVDVLRVHFSVDISPYCALMAIPPTIGPIKCCRLKVLPGNVTSRIFTSDRRRMICAKGYSGFLTSFFYLLQIIFIWEGREGVKATMLLNFTCQMGYAVYIINNVVSPIKCSKVLHKRLQ